MLSSWIERQLDRPVNDNDFLARALDMSLNTPVIKWAVALGLVAGLVAVVEIQQAEERIDDTRAQVLSHYYRFRSKIF
mgnify:CR=1 FL=1